MNEGWNGRETCTVRMQWKWSAGEIEEVDPCEIPFYLQSFFHHTPPLYDYTSTALLHCVTTPPLHYPIVWLHLHCTPPSYDYTSTALLHRMTTPPLHSSIVWLHLHCTPPLYDYTSTALLHRMTTPPLHSSMPPQHYSFYLASLPSQKLVTYCAWHVCQQCIVTLAVVCWILVLTFV